MATRGTAEKQKSKRSTGIYVINRYVVCLLDLRWSTSVYGVSAGAALFIIFTITSGNGLQRKIQTFSEDLFILVSCFISLDQ